MCLQLSLIRIHVQSIQLSSILKSIKLINLNVFAVFEVEEKCLSIFLFLSKLKLMDPIKIQIIFQFMK